MEDAMIDWFVLLVPLAVLPVFLIFGFVGCVLDTEGIPAAPGFTYPAGLPVPIGSVLKLKVKMEVTGEDGDSKSEQQNRSPEGIIIKPTGETIEFPSIDLEEIDAEEEGTASCTVTLTISGNPDTTLPPLSASHNNPTADFTLSVTGFGNKAGDFTLT
jgi:hypothetical protein